MNAVVREVLLIFAALLPIVNPLGMAPIFAEMTLGYSEKIRRTVAMRVAINGVGLLVASLFIGSYVLQFFGISLAAVQVGGGLVVTIAGWSILNKKNWAEDKKVESAPNSQEILSQAFYPITMPLTVGPGSIAVALTLGSNLHVETHLQLVNSALAAVVGILCDRGDHLPLLLVVRRIAAGAWPDGHQHPDPSFGVLGRLHRHSDHVQRAAGFLPRPEGGHRRRLRSFKNLRYR